MSDLNLAPSASSRGKKQNYEIVCETCGKKEVRHAKNAKFCVECAKYSNRAKAKERMRKITARNFGWMWYLLAPEENATKIYRTYSTLDYGSSCIDRGRRTPKKSTRI